MDNPSTLIYWTPLLLLLHNSERYLFVFSTYKRRKLDDAAKKSKSGNANARANVRNVGAIMIGLWENKDRKVHSTSTKAGEHCFMTRLIVCQCQARKETEEKICIVHSARIARKNQNNVINPEDQSVTHSVSSDNWKRSIDQDRVCVPLFPLFLLPIPHAYSRLLRERVDVS